MQLPTWTTRSDVVAAVVLTAGVVGETATRTGNDVVLRTALASLISLALVWRSRQPALFVGVVSLALAVESLATESPDEISVLIVLLVTAFSVPAYAQTREALLGIAVLSGAIALSISVDPSDEVANIVPTLLLFVTVPAGLGFAFRRRGQAIARLALSNQALREEAETAVEDERRRIARELHDVVSHAVTLIAVQAEAGKSLVEDDPAAARRTLSAIGETSRDALAELQAMLLLLRHHDDAPAEARGLARLDALAEGARAAGVVVAVERSGTAAPLSGVADQTAYRVAQEAVTNALRHTQAPRVTIAVEELGPELCLRITSVGKAHHAAYGSTGSGLAGLRERVQGLGGRFECGPDGEHGFTVVATLPRDHA